MRKAIQEKLLKQMLERVREVKFNHKLPSDPIVERSLMDIYLAGAQDALMNMAEQMGIRKDKKINN